MGPQKRFQTKECFDPATACFLVAGNSQGMRLILLISPRATTNVDTHSVTASSYDDSKLRGLYQPRNAQSRAVDERDKVHSGGRTEEI